VQQILANYFRAAFPAIVIQTTEETRVTRDVIAAAKTTKRTVITWSALEGMVPVGGRAMDDTEDLQAACRKRGKDNVFILHDAHTWPFDRDPVLLRAFREFLTDAPSTGCSVVMTAPEFRPHPTIEKLCVVMDYSLPSPEDLQKISEGIAEGAKKKIKADQAVLRALGGLTTTEAENALALSMVESGTFDPSIIYREKVKAVKRSGLLDLVEADPRGLEAVGGLDALKEWINKRRRVWSPEAVAFGLPSPKGILLVGVPGTGKSLCAKAIGTALAVPTLKLDIGSMFNSLVGESEARIRDALKLAEALAPCALWVDEIDKGLAGASGSGAGDSGTTKRMFGTIISWMQERRRSVFLIATANDVTALPPELLRKGRFDELFAVDLPSLEERKAILNIHIRNRKRDSKNFDLEAIASVMENFTGSEIEAVLDEALFSAFDEGKELNTAHLVTAAKAIIPLAETAKPQIDAIREWASKKARFASYKTIEVKTGRKLTTGN
jgi:hypothetical protein